MRITKGDLVKIKLILGLLLTFSSMLNAALVCKTEKISGVDWERSLVDFLSKL